MNTVSTYYETRCWMATSTTYCPPLWWSRFSRKVQIGIVLGSITVLVIILVIIVVAATAGSDDSNSALTPTDPPLSTSYKVLTLISFLECLALGKKLLFNYFENLSAIKRSHIMYSNNLPLNSQAFKIETKVLSD